MITNHSNLPEALVRAISNDSYSKGESDFSVTELLQPPRIRALKLRYKDVIIEDASDRIWSLLGQAVHTILERANNKDLSEKRFFAKFGKHIVSAQIDTLDKDQGILSDYKVTTAWKFIGNKPPPTDYMAQLNMQLEILRQNGIDAKELRIIGILRDWQMKEARLNLDYPQYQVVAMPIPIWPRKVVQDFINYRIHIHLESEKELPICSNEERWATIDKFAVIKSGQKRATKLCDSLAEAHDYASNMVGFKVELRPGVSKRCESYCIVSKYCDQYKQTKGDEDENRDL